MIYAGQANTLGVASNLLTYDSGNKLNFGAPGAGGTANANSSAPSLNPVTAMLTKSLYENVWCDISKINTKDLQMFNY